MPSLVNKDRGKIGSNVMRKGALIGLASVGHHSTDFTRFLLYKTIPMNYIWSYHWIVGRSLSDAYNIIFDQAKKGDFEFVFTLEEDTVPEDSNVFVKFINKMKYNPDIFGISAVYPRKGGVDPTPFFYRGNGRGSYLDWKWGEFFEVSSIPFGCSIFRTSDLHKMDEFVEEVLVENYPMPGKSSYVKDYCHMAPPKGSEKGTEMGSQDLYFCEQAGKAGLNFFIDASVSCYHIDITNGIKYVVPKDPHMLDFRAQEGKKAVNLGCGEETKYIHGVKPVRVDFREEVRPDVRADLRDLTCFEDDEFDYVYSSHTLEHFVDREARAILSEMARICKPGGEIQLILPNVQAALEALQAGGSDIDYVWWLIYGEAGAPWNEHKTGFTPEKIGTWLKHLGFKAMVMKVETVMMIRAFKPPFPDWLDDWWKLDKSDWNYNLYFNHDRYIRVNGKFIPIDDKVPQEGIDAFFTPKEKVDADRAPDGD